MINVQFDMRPNPRAVVVKLGALGADIRSFRVPLERSVRQVLVPSIARNFDEGGRPEPWAPLSDETVRIRESEGFAPEPILVRSGKLKRGATQINIWKVGMEEASLSGLPERVKYGNVHDQGLDAGRAGRMPQRQFLMIQPEDEEHIERVFATWLDERIAAFNRL